MVEFLASGSQRIDHRQALPTTLQIVMQINHDQNVSSARGARRNFVSRKATI
jgi:hypothetical protein